MERNNLRGKIIGEYRTVKNFSKAVKWSTRKAYDIVNGKQELTGKDIETICEALHVDIPEDFHQLFFSV